MFGEGYHESVQSFGEYSHLQHVTKAHLYWSPFPTLSDAIDDLDLKVKEFLSNGETATQQWKDENYKSLKQVIHISSSVHNSLEN